MKRIVHQYKVPKGIEGFFIFLYGGISAIITFIIGNTVVSNLELDFGVGYIIAASILVGMCIAYLWDITCGKVNRIILGIEGLRVYKDDELMGTYKLSDIIGPRCMAIGKKLPISVAKGLRVVTQRGNLTTLKLGLFRYNDFIQFNEDVNILLKRVSFLEEEGLEDHDENFFETQEFDLPRKTLIINAKGVWVKKASTISAIGLILLICLVGAFIFIPGANPSILGLVSGGYILAFMGIFYLVTAHSFRIYRDTFNYTPGKIRFNNNGIISKRASVDADLIRSISMTNEKLRLTSRHLKNYRWMIVETSTRTVRFMFGPKIPDHGEFDESYQNYPEIVKCVKKWAEIKKIEFIDINTNK